MDGSLSFVYGALHSANLFGFLGLLLMVDLTEQMQKKLPGKILILE